MRALIIEDHAAMADLIERWMAPLVDDVLKAETLQDALPIIESVSSLEIVTLDLTMPQSSREQTIREFLVYLRGRLPNALILVITGTATLKEKDLILEHGADDMILKDDLAKPSDLINRIRDVVMAIVRVPKRYRDNLATFEVLTQKLTEYYKNEV